MIPRDVLVVRLSSLGDIVHALPAFAALRRARPEARISWVAEPAGAALLRLVPGLDEIVVRGAPGWRRALRRRDRVAVDFQGLLKSAWTAARSGARLRAGFSGRNLRERAAAAFYNLRLPEFEETGHVYRKNLRLLSLLGVDEAGAAFPLEIPAGAVASARAKLAEAAPDAAAPGARVVVCNVGAAWPTKRWPAASWARLIAGLREPGIVPVLLWGTPVEKAEADAVAGAAGAPVLPFLALPEVLAVLRGARLLVSGDTFALQAACALSVRTLGLFGPTDPVRNGPFDPRDRAVRTPLDCRGCYRRSCEGERCMAAIPPDEVLRNAREMLERA